MKKNQTSQIVQGGESAKENFMEWGTGTVESESHLKITHELQPVITNEVLAY